MTTKKTNLKYIMDLLKNDKKIKITLQENIDVDKLNFIIENPELFNEKFDKKDWDEGYDPFVIAKKYLEKSVNGKVKVSYYQKRNVGRFFAKNSLSMQSLSKEIRHTIQKGYVDVDVVNAHPVFLNHLCDYHKIPNERLKYYIENRDEILNEIEDGKRIFLSLLNGGNKAYKECKNKTPFLREFKEEVELIHKKLTRQYKEEYKELKKRKKEEGKTHNTRGSFVNILLCSLENMILMNIYSFYGKPKDAVLCFDGLMINENMDPKLEECEKLVYSNLGIKIKLKIKPFDLGFDLSNYDIKKYKPVIQLKEYFSYNKIINKEVQMELVDEWMNNNVFLIDKGGKNNILTRNGNIDTLTKQYTFHYEVVKTEKFLNTMRATCYILNDEYDEELHEQVKKGVIKKNDLTDEEKFKIKKYVFNTLNEYFDHAIKTRKIKTYSGVEFEPFLGEDNKPELYDKFNMFTGFFFENYKIENENKIEFEGSPFYNHIRDQMCRGNEGEFNHLLDFIADIIQRPANVRGNGHLFISEQGTGKGLLAFFIQKLIGSQYCITYDNIKNYFKSFNMEQANKLFKVIEEVSDKGEAFSKADVLKADLTKMRDRIEPKGIDAYTINHYGRYFFFTNNDQALYIENSDRRYTIHKIKSDYANNKKYFDPMWKDVRDNEYCKVAFDFFATREYNELDVMEAYVNEIKTKQKVMNLSIVGKCIFEMIEDDFKGVDRYKNGYISITSFKDLFKGWCKDNGLNFKSTTLKTQLTKLGIEQERIYIKEGEKNKLVRAYNFNSEHLQDIFKKHLKDDNLTFDIIPRKEGMDKTYLFIE